MPDRSRGDLQVKLSNLVYAGVGYVLGAQAGHERYEQIVRVSRRVAGSQTVQSTAGVIQAQVEVLGAHARHLVAHKLSHDEPPARVSPNSTAYVNGVNGKRR